jgi:hypothetical protein
MHTLLHFERRNQPVAPSAIYAARVVRNLIAGGLLVLVSLSIGALGYHSFERLPWIDAFLNAAMILGGMGPVATLVTNGGKIFATVYALYSGLILLISAGIIMAPPFHRLLHRFHMDE